MKGIVKGCKVKLSDIAIRNRTRMGKRGEGMVTGFTRDGLGVYVVPTGNKTPYIYNYSQLERKLDMGATA